MSLQPGQVLNNRYRVVRLLGQGGFGAVYRAWDVNLNRPCAVKENMDTSPEAQRQFTREATILANLSHPNLPRVTDHFILPGQGQYLVMDFVEGEDLASLVRRQRTVSPEQAVQWICQVADALIYLHSRNPVVVHRDVKPANIRITPEGRAMLVDFGLVKLFNPSMRTTLGARAVTPGYAPPEQYGQGATDARTDLYALGATLYNLLTGKEPMESVQRMAGGKMPAASTINPQVPVALSAAIEQAMRLEPGARYANVAEFKAALQTRPDNVYMVRPVPEAIAAPVIRSAQPPQAQVSAAPPRVYPVEPDEPHARTQTNRSWLWLIAGLVVVLCIGGIGVFSVLLASGQRSTRQTQTAQALATQSAQLEVTSTAQAQASATAEVLARQTAQAESTRQAADAALALIEASKIQVFGPRTGSLPHDAQDSLIASFDADVNLKNFIVQARFFNPYGPKVGAWDYGFILRASDTNDEYRFVVRSDGVWELLNVTGDPNNPATIASGELSNLDTGEKGYNLVKVIFQDARGFFFLNEQWVAEFDVSPRMGAGNIEVATGFYQGDEIDGYATGYGDFIIWSIP